MRHYELMVIFSPMLSQQEVGEAWTRVKDFVTGRRATIDHDQRMGTRRLAYAIRKGSHNFLEGNYHLLRFSTETSFVRELETFLRLDERILRYLTVNTAPPKPAPAPKPAEAAPAAAAEGSAPAEQPAAAVASAAAESAQG